MKRLYSLIFILMSVMVVSCSMNENDNTSESVIEEEIEENVEEEFSPLTLRIFSPKDVVIKIEDYRVEKYGSIEIKNIKFSTENILEYVDVYIPEIGAPCFRVYGIPEIIINDVDDFEYIVFGAVVESNKSIKVGFQYSGTYLLRNVNENPEFTILD